MRSRINGKSTSEVKIMHMFGFVYVDLSIGLFNIQFPKAYLLERKNSSREFFHIKKAF